MYSVTNQEQNAQQAMKNYESYTLNDFIQDESFRDWVQGNGNLEVFWISFEQNYPGKTEILRQAEQLIRAAHVDSDYIGEKEVRSEVQIFIERASLIGSQDEEVMLPLIARKEHFSFSAVNWRVSVAALLLVGIGLGWYFYPHERSSSASVPAASAGSNLVRTSNDTEKQLTILLGDGSEVILSPKSSLSYPSQFGDGPRTVYLVGEASFSVKRQGQTFMVYSGDVVTKVLGTRFVVKAFEKDKKITVQVQTGKVSVYLAKPESVPDQNKKALNGLILTANQAAVFEKSISQLSKSLVDNPVKLVKVPDEIVSKYEEVPLPVLFTALEKAYGIPIQFDAENFQGCKITAVLSNESLFEKLDILCKVVSANYEIVDGQIVVSGKGCK